MVLSAVNVRLSGIYHYTWTGQQTNCSIILRYLSDKRYFHGKMNKIEYEGEVQERMGR